MFDLKPISPEAIPAALGKAERYRLLNEPVEAESICRDVLQIDSDNQQAAIVLLLALTDQFDTEGADARVQAIELLSHLHGQYERAYYAGIIHERWAKAHLHDGTPGHVVYDWLHLAMDWFEKAEMIAPPRNDDAILRWNACVRLLRHHDRVRPFEVEVGIADDFGEI